MVESEVLLHRRRGPAWKFVPHPEYDYLAHITRRGTVYLMVTDPKKWKPFWIGRVFVNGIRMNGKTVVLMAEDRIGAVKIEFPNGGEYIFPR